jgi:hypothetical protein
VFFAAESLCRPLTLVRLAFGMRRQMHAPDQTCQIPLLASLDGRTMCNAAYVSADLRQRLGSWTGTRPACASTRTVTVFSTPSCTPSASQGCRPHCRPETNRAHCRPAERGHQTDPLALIGLIGAATHRPPQRLPRTR